MTYRKTCAEYLLIVLTSMSIVGVLQTVHPVRAAGTLFIDPPNVGLASPGGTVTVGVSVDSVDQFTGWDIALTTNTTGLNGSSIDYNVQNLFPTGSGGGNIFVADNCVNGNPAPGAPACDFGNPGSLDGPGVVQFAGTFIPPSSGPPPGPMTGVLFNINFIAGPGTYTKLKFIKFELDHCTQLCTPLTNFNTQDGVYGTQIAPDINFSIHDRSLSVIQGSHVNTSLTVSSVKFFSGQVNFAYRCSPLSRQVAVSFNVSSVNIDNVTAPTAHANLTVTAGPAALATHYLLNITATGPRVFQYLLVDLSVQPPGDFIISTAPSILYVAQNSSSLATMTVSSQPRQLVQQEFSGNVTLRVAAVNATVNLGQTKVYLSQGATAVTTLSVFVPISFNPFTYLINITGFWDKNPQLNYTYQLVVTHLPYDLIPSVSPGVLTITAGQSGHATLIIAGLNYFEGPVYASSTMSGGTARYDAPDTFVSLGQTASIGLNITIDPATVPGNYVVLLTAYTGSGYTRSETAISRSVTESIVVKAGQPIAPLPTKILGLTVPVYFGILGGFAVIFVLLSVLVYRKSRLDRDVWE